MKLCKMKLYAFLLLISSTFSLHSQTLNILEKSGTAIPISINNIRSLIFSTGNLNINLKVGIPISKALSTVQYLNFTPTTDIYLPSNQKNSTLQLFPNPTLDFINISYQCNNNLILDLKIISIDGRTMFSETINGMDINQFKVNTITWQKGLYIVLINDGQEVISGKIFKN